jgi:hypothetical protein
MKKKMTSKLTEANCKVQTIFDEIHFWSTVLDLSFTALKILFYHVSGTSTLDDFFAFLHKK